MNTPYNSELKAGINRENLDESVKPTEDFYHYACGGWMKSHPLKPEFSRFGTFDAINDKAREQLRDLIIGLKDNPDAQVSGTNAQKVYDLYQLGMDSTRLNQEGNLPLKPLLEHVTSTPINKLWELVAWLHDGISAPFFSTGVGPDAKNSSLNIMHVGEAGLSLGDRDYYIEENDNNKKIMEAFHTYVVSLMELCDYTPQEAERVWQAVIKIEKKTALHKMTREQRRDPLARYHIFTYADLKETYPNIDWQTYFTLLNINNLSSLNVVSPDYLKFINDFIPTLSEQELKDYLAYDIISESTQLLSDSFSKTSFELFGRVMCGIEEQRPRWKRAMAIPNSMLGEAVGQLYVEKYFPQENKQYMMAMVENLRKALTLHIDNLSWMSDTTKSKAKDKLESLSVKIGFPDKWKDYSGISINPEKSYLENVLEASRWYNRENYKKLNQEVDRTEWHMTPQTVNAYYSPIKNEICFPAGILQPPYFDITADDAQNYGSIGVVIGHEMTHGFDDSGRKYDKDGNLNNWWTSEDSDKFTNLADKLVEQFNTIEVAPGVKANGRFTLGENIADQGGIRVALTAYLNYSEADKQKDIDGFSPLKRFFISYANTWSSNIRPEEILVRTKTDPHSLEINRVNATLRNIDAFLEAFDIKEGDKMFRPNEERIVIW